MGHFGGRYNCSVVLKIRGTTKFFMLGKFLKKSYVTPVYLLKIVFPKFDPLTVTGMALGVDLGPKFQNLFSIV